MASKKWIRAHAPRTDDTTRQNGSQCQKMWFQIPAQGVFSACQSTQQSARAHEALRPPHMGWFRGYQYTYMASRLIGSILRHFGSFLGGLLYCEGVGRVVVLAACKYITEVSTRCDRSVDCL